MTSEERLAVLRNRVEVQEERLRLAVVELGAAARDAIDPRHWIQRRPLLWAAGAFALGAWLGARRGGSA